MLPSIPWDETIKSTWEATEKGAIDTFKTFFKNKLLHYEFDKEGAYIKKWIPELKDLPSSYIHKPWKAPADVLEKANVTLDQTYPTSIIDYKALESER
ncbi:FAD-binding domain-containing protein [Priestia aryabhattai]|uniref:FAD-binding domain-containing protein n=1 Tax=Priestia megaterium TaxID=1404 RepID=UPI0039B881DE